MRAGRKLFSSFGVPLVDYIEIDSFIEAVAFSRIRGNRSRGGAGKIRVVSWSVSRSI